MDKNIVSKVYSKYKVSIRITLLFILLSSSAAQALLNSSDKYATSTSIDSCTTISSPGTYVLNQSIINSNASNCIEITSNDVVFDGAGYTIDGIDTSNTNGIYVFNVNTLTNVSIKNAKVTDWNNGIYYKGIIDGNIANNNASSNSNGIYIYSSGGVALTGNNVSSNNNGIFFISSSGNTLNSNTANSNNNNGIYLSSSSSNTLNSNIVNSNSKDGFYFISSTGNTLTNNTANSNNRYGIFTETSTSNILISNIVNSNSNNGIYFSFSGVNTLTSNNVTSNLYGIYFYSSGSNVLTSNTANSNIYSGIFFNSYSGSNILTSNTANLNNGGIYFYDNSGGNNLTSNNANLNSYDGIQFIYRSGNNILTSNIVNLNSIGIYFYDNSGGNNLTGNTVKLSSGNGITISSSGSNTIYNNYFSNTRNFVIGDGSNKWNTTKQSGTNIIGGSSIGGNFWALPNDMGFSQTCNDAYGICDSPYTLDSNNIDYLPLIYNIAPPASITNLTNITYAPTHINFTWADPKDPDFANVSVWIDGAFKDNIPEGLQFYNATGLVPDTEHEIATRTMDNNGNVNLTWVNLTAKTAPVEADLPPVAGCGPDKLKCENVDSPVRFNASESYDPDGSIISYEWEFGDDATGTGIEPNHTYKTYMWNGTAYLPFIVNLTVTDNNGLTGSASQLVNIWIAGDANGDGRVNILDASVVGLKWNGADPCADLNNDGKVNILDASIIGLNWGHFAKVE